eukprot:c16300_g1_i1 orf=357-1487(-)
MDKQMERHQHSDDKTLANVVAEKGCHGGVEHVQPVQQCKPSPGFGADYNRPCVLITNDDGIRAPGLTALAKALINSGCCQVYICAPNCNKSGASHSITAHDTVEVSSFKIEGAIAYEVSGTPADCVSLSLSGVIFPPTKPSLVLSGINKGSNIGYHQFYSGTVAGAREAVICGVPAMSLSLNWKTGESLDTDFDVTAGICLPLIKTALHDLDRGGLSNSFFLNVDIPTSPSENKGFKVTRQATLWLPFTWRAVSPQRSLSGSSMNKDNTIGIRLAELGAAASAVGAARKVDSPLQNTEIESIAGPGNASESLECREKWHFCLHHSEAEIPNVDIEYDLGALQEGYVTVTPLGLSTQHDLESSNWVADWISTMITSS